jgi:hypothetical protein
VIVNHPFAFGWSHGESLLGDLGVWVRYQSVSKLHDVVDGTITDLTESEGSSFSVSHSLKILATLELD